MTYSIKYPRKVVVRAMFRAVIRGLFPLLTRTRITGLKKFPKDGPFTPDASGALPVQRDSAIQAIRLFTGPVPAVLLILAVLFAWNYPITRESHQATLQELAAREA